MVGPQVQFVSEDDENGLRLRILMGKATEVLRTQFHQYFSNDPSTLFQQLLPHQKLLKKYLRQKILYNDQYELLFPASGLTDSAFFDISLLTFLLRQLCGLPEPVAGWSVDPLVTDQTQSANLVRIRKGRNKLQHGALKIDAAKFTQIWDEISNAIIGLGCAKRELIALKTCPLDQNSVQKIRKSEVQLKAALKRVAHLEDCLDGISYDIFPPISSFLGREKYVQKIHEDLVNMDESKMALVVTGLGGVGKSEVVRQYCLQYSSTYYSHNTIWINAESQESIASAFNNVAELIKLDVKEENGQFLDIKVVVTKVFRFFGGRNVLFVFDNVLCEADIKDFLNIYIQTDVQKPYVVMTSQYMHWGQRFIQHNLSVFSPSTAEECISCNLKNKDSLKEDSNKLLCAMVQYLPLALQQAAAYIRHTGMTVDTYLDQFKSHKELLLSERHGDMLYNKTVMTTWSMAIDKIKETNNSLALALINIMSYLDGKSIKKELFLDFSDNDIVVLNKAIDILEQYSLINISSDIDDSRNTITVHSLVQSVIQISEEDTKHLQSFLDAILQKSQKCSPENLAFEDLWVDHVTFIVQSHENKEIFFTFLEHLLTLHEVYFRKGKLNHLLGIMKTLERFGSQNRVPNSESLNISFYLALCLFVIVRYDEAVEIYYDLQKKHVELYGPKSQGSLSLQSNIASCLEKQGKVDESLRKYIDLEKQQLEILGPKDPRLWKTQSHIGASLILQDKLSEGLEIYYAVEKKRLEEFGTKHPDLLRLQSNIASCLRRQGRINEALAKYYEVEEKQIELFGIKHPDLATTKYWIAFCLQKHNKFDEALEKYYEVEQQHLALYREKSPALFDTQHRIAWCLEKKGRVSEALEKYYEVERKRIEQFGPTNRLTLTTQNNIASILCEQGNFNKALEKFYSIEKKQLEVFGLEDHDLINTQQNIKDCLDMQGETSKYSSEEFETKEFQTLEQSSTDLQANRNCCCVIL